MIKKIICAAVACALTAIFASCSCAGSTSATTPPASVAINENMQIGEMVNYVTQYEWVNEENGDDLDFQDDGSFFGKIEGKSVSGKFTLTLDKKKLGRLIVGVTLTGASKEVKYKIDFKDSAHMTLTTNKGKSESFTADWAVK
ncbi:MAG: hypothetical protein IIU14_04890 [Ruminococcus sp.]|nr:hypothetical protein [Ruminococcus sp.]